MLFTPKVRAIGTLVAILLLSSDFTLTGRLSSSEGLSRGLAYHLNTSKVQELGNLSPTHYETFMGIQPFIEGFFPYTPWMGEFPEEN